MKILKYGSAILRKKAARVVKVDQKLKELAEAMLSAMHASKGIGLAANQVGVLERLIVIDVARGDKKSEPLYLVNPEIIEEEGSCSFEEGCLSFPEIYSEVERPAIVTVKYTDLSGKSKQVKAEGILARVLQHEIDHLDGVLFVDHISKIRRMLLSKKLKELEKKTKGK